MVLAAVRGSSAASYLVAVMASQLLSPVLWDHYAMLLLLPVAYLLERRQWWAVLDPAGDGGVPHRRHAGAAYPIAFWVTLVALVLVGLREGPPGRRRTRRLTRQIAA